MFEDVDSWLVDEAEVESVLERDDGWESWFAFDDGDDVGDAQCLEFFFIASRPVIR